MTTFKDLKKEADRLSTRKVNLFVKAMSGYYIIGELQKSGGYWVFISGSAKECAIWLRGFASGMANYRKGGIR